MRNSKLMQVPKVAGSLPDAGSTRYTAKKQATRENIKVRSKQEQARWCPPHERALHELKPKAPFGHYHPRQDSYYAKTAYSADKPRASRYSTDLSENYPKKFKFKRLSHYAAISGYDYFGNSTYLASTKAPSLTPEKGEFLKIKNNIRARDFDAYHTIYVGSARNVASLFYLLAVLGYAGLRFCTYLIIISAVVVFILGDTHTWYDVWQLIEFVLMWMLGSFLTWKIFGWIAYKLPNDKSIKFKRRIGMVCFPQKGKLPDKEIPFAEFEPRIMLTSGSGGLSHRLVYVHQSGSPILPLGYRTQVDVYTRAAFLEQFMDITRPLPDIPSLEWCRDKDPTTKAFDQATGRPPRFWRDKSAAEIEKMQDETSDKVKSILGKGSASC